MMDNKNSRNATLKNTVQECGSIIIPEVCDVNIANVMFDAGFRILSKSSAAIGWVSGTPTLPISIIVSLDRVSDLIAYSGSGVAWVSPGTELLRFVVCKVHSTACKLFRSGAFQDWDRLISNGEPAHSLR